MTHADSASPPAHGPSNLAHHFENLEQQHDANTLGMWMFLATEVLFFGAILTSFFIYRWSYTEEFEAAAKKLSVPLATTNTVVLIFSSLTMALSLHCARTGNKKGLVGFLIATMILGTAFLGIKAVEWTQDYYEHLVPGINFDATVESAEPFRVAHGDVAEAFVGRRKEGEPTGPSRAAHGEEPKWPAEVDPHKAELFFVFYFCMTGLHGLHMIVGLAIALVLLHWAWRGRYTKEYFTPIEVFGLYWHFVDIVWVFLFPILYLLHS